MIIRQTYRKPPTASNRGAHNVGRKLHARWVVEHVALGGATWTFDKRESALRFDVWLDTYNGDRPLRDYEDHLRTRMTTAMAERDFTAARQAERSLNNFNPY
jgi:hypothetical protein